MFIFSIFSFSQNDFQRSASQWLKYKEYYGKGMNRWLQHITVLVEGIDPDQIVQNRRFDLGSSLFTTGINPFPNDKFWTLPHQNYNFKFDGNGRKFSKPVENIVGKGEIARYDSVFKRLLLQTRRNQGLFGKGLGCIL